MSEHRTSWTNYVNEMPACESVEQPGIYFWRLVCCDHREIRQLQSSLLKVNSKDELSLLIERTKYIDCIALILILKLGQLQEIFKFIVLVYYCKRSVYCIVVSFMAAGCIKLLLIYKYSKNFIRELWYLFSP